MKTTYLITDIELKPYPGERPDLIGSLWEAEDDYDLLEKVKDYTGLRIKSLGWQEVLVPQVRVIPYVSD